MRFIVNTFIFSFLLSYLLRWAKQEADQRLEQMQDSAYDTPGAESPVPPQVVLGAMGLVGGHFVLGSSILKQQKRTTFLSFIIGSLVGVMVFLRWMK